MSQLRVVSNDVSVPVETAMSDMELLQRISTDLIVEHDPVALYGKIVDAAMTITGSQFGTMQLRRERSDGTVGLELLTSRNLTPQDRAFWQWVPPTAHSSCIAALKSGSRAMIPDFEIWDEIIGTEDLEAFRRAGIRSAQTTPLVARDGKLLGMISTHWSQPHHLTDREIRLLDIVARQAADLLERTLAEEALRQRQRELDQTVATLREAQDLQRMLTNELGHRVKNLFAMVNAITSQTMRGSSDLARVQTLQQRLMALSGAHDILLESHWKAAPLGEVAAAAANGAGVSGRIRIAGPEITVGSKAALNVALLLHELTTNALKHGSLSVGGGYVDLTWRIENEILRLTWRESKGPEVSKPERTGFGSKLISAGLSGSGGVVVAYNPAGLVCEISAPLAELQGDG